MHFRQLLGLAADPAAAYVAQATLGLVMFFIFRHFSLVYDRRFLQTWSRGWLAFSVYMIATVVLMISLEDEDYPPAGWIPVNVIAQVGAFLHIVYILIGSYQLVRSKPVNRRIYQSIIVGVILLGIVTVLAFGQHPEGGYERYLFRIGSRALISGIGFLLAGIVVWRNPKFTRGVGQKLLTVSFVAFSGYQFFYIFIMIFDAASEQAMLPGSRGLINLMMISIMSMSMVMWLLEDEREKLRQVNKDLDSFLYSTSHDLRAPITSILGLTYLGKVELTEEKGRNYMELIEQRAQKLNMILTDVLRLSKTKKLGIKLQTIRFSDLVKEVVSDIEFTKGTSSIRLDYEKNSDSSFYSDPNQISIILSNLITNAVKYHRLNQDDPYIRIRFKRISDTVIFTVEDNGQGIHPHSVNKIFDMFFRASQETDGTGLGLYIVKEALAKVKGKIDVESEFGKGTTFTVTLENA
ncbi:MAG: HAMP domain-containing histidine kinase [Cyclobacteriaceae bacterium]|jgi:signal transduction histidine kinase|nr:HAMP domain-containing histidine kinase [Cyclobacteriaceae bacterium]